MSRVRFAFNEFVRDVVAVPPRALHRVARRQTLTIFVEQFAREWAGRRLGRARRHQLKLWDF